MDEADLVEQAVQARDEHAIKFTEACLRAYHRSGDGAFVEAARDAVVGALPAEAIVRVELIAQPHPEVPSLLLGAEGTWVRGKAR